MYILICDWILVSIIIDLDSVNDVFKGKQLVKNQVNEDNSYKKQNALSILINYHINLSTAVNTEMCEKILHKLQCAYFVDI